ncbi:hypothetical protein WME73_40875 [Sorangium sp. So ce302]|uniref:PEGA domain-containing protein n=1 Tax=Sorangium sp. So ce302 TaxID=3133297 RepID=UPI003F617443
MRNLKMHVAGAALCALSACALAPAAALAQPAPPAAAASGDDEGRGDNARATQLYRDGNEAFKQKRWSDAELLYLKAWALVRTFDIAANLGEVQIQLNKVRSAAAFLAFALRTAPPSTKPEQIARIRHFLDEAKAQVGTLRVRVKNVADAEVYVDGERVPEDAVKHELYVEPGEHTLVIRRAGYEDEVVRLVAAPGVTETVMPELKPKAVKAPETSAAGAKVPGAGGSKGAQGAAAAAKGEAKTKAPAAGARVEEQRSWVPVIALGAASAVGLGVAVGFTVASNDASADAHRYSDVLARANEQCIAPRGEFMETCTQTSDAASRAGTMGDLALGSYIVSAGLAIAAAAYAVWPNPQKSTETAVRVTPFGGSRTAGVIVAGAW